MLRIGWDGGRWLMTPVMTSKRGKKKEMVEPIGAAVAQEVEQAIC